MSAATELDAYLERLLGTSRDDGGRPRPLYRYPITPERRRRLHEELARAVRASLEGRGGRHGWPNVWAAALFCLAAADWWRRRYEGGAFGWEPVLRGVGLGYLLAEGAERYRKRVTEWTVLGLAFLLSTSPYTGEAGRTEYLRSLFRAGGLPLGALGTPSGGRTIEAYFAEVLDRIRLYGLEGSEGAEDLAAVAREAAEHLPRYLQDEGVYRDAGRIAGWAWCNRSRLLGAPEEAAGLEYPAGLGEETAEPVRAALRRALGLAHRREEAQLRIETRLAADPWRLERVLCGPEHLCDEDLGGLLPELDRATRERVQRVGLVLRGEDGQHHPAGALCRDEDHGWRVDAAPTAMVVGSGGEVSLLALAGPRAVVVPTPGREALGALPWVFAPARGGGWRLLGVGPARARAGELVVLASAGPVAGVVRALEAEPRRLAGRRAYRVAGRAVFPDPDGGEVIVEARADADRGTRLRLVGPRVREHLGRRPTWRGMPRVLGAERVEVRDPRGTWRPPREDEVGALELRAFAVGGVALRERVDVVPAGLHLELESGDGRRPPAWLVAAPGLAGVGLDARDPDWAVEPVRGQEGAWRVACPSGEAGSPVVPLRLRFRGGAEVRLRVVAPGAHLAFVGPDGEACSPEDVVSLAEMEALQAVARAAHEGERLVLSAAAPAPWNRHSTVTWTWELPRARGAGGIARLPLAAVRPAVEALLFAAAHHDRTVELQLEVVGGRARRRLRVRRDDDRLVPDRAAGVLRLAGRTPVEGPLCAIHLARPAKRFEVPPREPGTWPLAWPRREGGPWLFFVPGPGRGYRVRPLLNTNREDPAVPVAEESLAAAVLQGPNRSARLAALGGVLDAVAVAPSKSRHWRELAEWLELLADVPALYLEVFQALAERPRAAARVVLAVFLEGVAGDAALDALAADLPRMGLLWEAVSRSDWAGAVAVSVKVEPGALPESVGSQLSEKLARLARRLGGAVPVPGLLAVARSLGERCPAGVSRDAWQALAPAMTREFLARQLELEARAFRLRLREETRPSPGTPTTAAVAFGPVLEAAPAGQRPFLAAPLRVAEVAARGGQLDAAARLAALHVRQLDETWYARAVLLGAALLLREEN